MTSLEVLSIRTWSDLLKQTRSSETWLYSDYPCGPVVASPIWPVNGPLPSAVMSLAHLCCSFQCQLALDCGVPNLLAAIVSGNHSSMTAEGTVYLLHFERPYRGRSRHYLGSTRNLEQRLASHRTECSLQASRWQPRKASTASTSARRSQAGGSQAMLSCLVAKTR
jgi:hypothetical protein